jgi:hypothetical protein
LVFNAETFNNTNNSTNKLKTNQDEKSDLAIHLFDVNKFLIF